MAELPTANFIGRDIPLKKGLHVVYIQAPGGNPAWIKLLQWIANWSRLWDNKVVPGLEKEWNVNKGKPNGLTLQMPKNISGKPKRYFRLKNRQGKWVTVSRKGFDPTRQALFFFVELV